MGAHGDQGYSVRRFAAGADVGVLTDMLDSKAIRKTVSEELHARLGAKWFKLDGGRLGVASTDKLTDFSIEFDCYADRRYGGYNCALAAVFKWKKFHRSFRDFTNWYNVRYQSTARPPPFLRVAFDRIDGNFLLGSRDEFWIANEQDLDAFIAQCVDDLDGKVGEWIKRWFTWSSALDVMNGNEQLCGSWRDHAYFCLLEQVHGREVACKWVGDIDATGWPEFLAAQVEYLQLQVCGGGSV
ncbi:MAG: hypothetical protein E5W98_30880 [Mesorhizobium sp.]|nr:MAG: hypothetical protein E5W98_30880 [Mesorhizobium sp.]